MPLALVERDAVAEMVGAREPGLAEELHRAVDRRGAHGGVLHAHRVVQLFARDVTLHGEEGVEDRLALACLLQAVAREVLRQLLVGAPVGVDPGCHRRATLSGAVSPVNARAEQVSHQSAEIGVGEQTE